MIPVPSNTLDLGRLVRTIDNRALGPLQAYLREFETGIVSEFRLVKRSTNSGRNPLGNARGF